MVETLSKEEKLKLLKALEEDLEFRYAVAGLIGISEILRRLDRLEEGQKRLWENQNRLWEEVRNLREGQNKLWEEVKSLRERQDRLWREVSSLKVAVESLGRRRDLDLERTVLEIYRYALEERVLKLEGLKSSCMWMLMVGIIGGKLNWNWMYMYIMRRFTSWK